MNGNGKRNALRNGNVRAGLSRARDVFPTLVWLLRAAAPAPREATYGQRFTGYTVEAPVATELDLQRREVAA